MTYVTRPLALTLAAFAAAAGLAAGGVSHAACEPLLDPDHCAGYLRDRLVPDRCEWREDGTIVCYYD